MLALSLAACAGASGHWAGGIHARLAWSHSDAESQGGVLRVLSVPEGPARQAGLQRNDLIMRIGGRAVQSMSKREAVQALRGSVGSLARIEIVRPPGSERRTLEIERVPYHR